jgi:hypothetical protein
MLSKKMYGQDDLLLATLLHPILSLHHGSLDSTGTGRPMFLPPCSQVPLAQVGSNGDGDDLHLVRVGGCYPLVLLRLLQEC